MRSCSHTKGQDDPWFRVDLQETINVARVSVKGDIFVMRKDLSLLHIRLGHIYLILRAGQDRTGQGI